MTTTKHSDFFGINGEADSMQKQLFMIFTFPSGEQQIKRVRRYYKGWSGYLYEKFIKLQMKSFSINQLKQFEDWVTIENAMECLLQYWHLNTEEDIITDDECKVVKIKLNKDWNVFKKQK